MPQFRYLWNDFLCTRFMRRVERWWWRIEDLPFGMWIAPFMVGSLIGVVLNAAIWGVFAILDPPAASVMTTLILYLALQIWRYRIQQNFKPPVYEEDEDYD